MKGGLVGGIVAGGALLGALGAYRPMTLGVVLLAGAASMPLVRRLARRPLVEVAVLGIVVLHAISLVRGMWFAKELWVFDTGRLPATLFVAVLLFAGGHERLLEGPARAAVGPVLVFFAWTGISGLAGIDPFHSVFHTGWLALMVVIIGLAMALHDSPHTFWAAWLKGLLVVGVLSLGASMVVILLGLEPAAAFRGIGNTQRPGYQGLFFSPNYLGIHACITIGAAMGLVALEPERSGRWFVPVVVLCLVSAVICASRAALLGTFLGLLAYAAHSWGAGSRRLGFAVVMFALFLGVGLQSGVGRTGFERLAGTGDLMEAGKEPRQIIWASYLRRYVERPVFGVGFQVYGTQGDRSVMRELGRSMTSHSIVIEYGLTTGLPGTLLFLWVLWGAARGLSTPEGRRCLPSIGLFWMSTAPSYLFDTMGTAPSQPATWPLLVMLLTARGFSGLPSREASAPDLALVAA
jgi:hypothetical protein